MNPTGQYFWAQPLQSALNGINSSNLIGVLSGVGYAILLMSFLWGVYESFFHGGDVRGFAVSLLKYGATTLVIQHWSQVFQDAVNGFGSIAGAIIQNSVNQDLTTSWTEQLQAYYAANSSSGLTNGLQAAWNIGNSFDTVVLNLLLTLVSVAIWPLCVEVFALAYSLWGCVLYCVGPLVLGLMPSMGFSRITKGYIQGLFIWNMWVVLIAVLWAMLWAMNLTSVNTILNTDGLLGFLQGVNATLLVSISTLLLSFCTLIVPFVARYVLHGDFGPAGAAAMLVFRRVASAAEGLFSAGAGAVALSATTTVFGGASQGLYGAGLAPATQGGFTFDGYALGSSGQKPFLLPPPETPPPDAGTRSFPRRGGPLMLPPAME
jgi:hypothetical protein